MIDSGANLGIANHSSVISSGSRLTGRAGNVRGVGGYTAVSEQRRVGISLQGISEDISGDLTMSLLPATRRNILPESSGSSTNGATPSASSLELLVTLVHVPSEARTGPTE